ncbi:MAG: leucine-rich repeat domain-containing protein [Kiritimatiellia bacterium]
MALHAAVSLPLQAGDFICTTNNDDTLCIVRYSGKGGDLTIPSSIDGKQVTVIGKGAFYRFGDLISITMPDSITNMEDGSLANVGGDASWVSWHPRGASPSGAFAGCTNLAKVTMGRQLTVIGDHAFACCSGLKEITVPDSVARVGRGAFALCTGLQKADLGGGVTAIGRQAFDHCKNLKQVRIGGKTAVIGDWAFHGCVSLENSEIPDSVTGIGHGAFRYCPKLEKVTIGNGVKTIGHYAFSRCPALKEVFFKGNAPGEVDRNLFFRSPDVTVYYLPQAKGWPERFGDRRTCFWKE